MKELMHDHANATDQVYGRIWDASGGANSGSIAQQDSPGVWAFYPTGSGSIDWTKVAVTMTARFGISRYFGDFPPLPAGLYAVQFVVRAGAVPVQGDAVVQGSGGLMDWDGEAPARIPSSAEVAAAVTAALATLNIVPGAQGELSFIRGDSATFSITGLGNISGNQEVWFTAKKHASDADTDSVLQVSRTVGLVYLNGAAGTAGDGSLTVDDATAGDITIALEPAASSLLDLAGLRYDVQVKTAGGDITTLAVGVIEVLADYTRAIA